MASKNTGLAVKIIVILVLVAVSVLVFNYMCEECLFEFPEGGGGFGGGFTGTGGGGGTPREEQETGFNFLGIFLIIIAFLLIFGGGAFAIKGWRSRKPRGGGEGEAPAEEGEPPEGEEPPAEEQPPAQPPAEAGPKDWVQKILDKQKTGVNKGPVERKLPKEVEALGIDQDINKLDELLQAVKPKPFLKLLDKTKNTLSKEPALIKLGDKGKFIFIGDLHGDFETLKRIYNDFLGPDGSKGYNLVFLGDYIDRGDDSVKTMAFLCYLKSKFPSKVTLLRGNHECHALKDFKPYTFPNDVKKMYWDQLGRDVYEKFTEIFDALPLMAWSGNGIFAVHGGFPTIEKKEDLKRITKETKGKILSIVWKDQLVPRFEDKAFTPAELSAFLEIMHFKVMIRGHQPKPEDDQFNKKCLTIMSSEYYKKVKNTPIRIAMSDLSEEITNTDDLEIKEL